MFVGQQQIVNYLHFFSKISGNCHKCFYGKMFDKVNEKCLLRCFPEPNWPVSQIFLEALRLPASHTQVLFHQLALFCFLLPLSNCFLRVYLPTHFATDGKNFHRNLPPNFMAHQIPTTQHPHVMRIRRKTYAKRKLLFSQELVLVQESLSTLSANTPIEWNPYLC